jgi:hypothetical protein
MHQDDDDDQEFVLELDDDPNVAIVPMPMPLRATVLNLYLFCFADAEPLPFAELYERLHLDRRRPARCRRTLDQALLRVNAHLRKIEVADLYQFALELVGDDRVRLRNTIMPNALAAQALQTRGDDDDLVT